MDTTKSATEFKLKMESLLTEALGYKVDLTPVRLSRRERLVKKITSLEKRQMDRLNAGRTRGAGAGGYNRDLDNIRHQIILLKIRIAELDGCPETVARLIKRYN